jgi:hypothetical protein
MPNAIKYKAGNLTGSLQKGNVALGVSGSFGPTSTTGWYNGPNPPTSGLYQIIETAASGDPEVYSPQNDAELIRFARWKGATGANTGSAAAVLAWIGTQTNLMAINFQYENIVTDGLIVNLDAGFVGSYPTTASIWYDLSGNNNSGSLTNGPTFNSANSGSIVFDGVDDYVATTSNIGISGANPRTVECWIYVDSFANKSILGYGGNAQGVLFDTLIWYSSYLNVVGHYYGGGYDTISTLPSRNTINISQWNQVVHMYDGTTVSLYTNGVFSNSKEFSVSNNNQLNTTNSTFLIGTGQYTGAYTFTTGKIALSRFYNRALTAAEVLQNYNAQKGRFGL